MDGTLKTLTGSLSYTDTEVFTSHLFHPRPFHFIIRRRLEKSLGPPSLNGVWIRPQFFYGFSASVTSECRHSISTRSLEIDKVHSKNQLPDVFGLPLCKCLQLQLKAYKSSSFSVKMTYKRVMGQSFPMQNFVEYPLGGGAPKDCRRFHRD